MRRLTEESLEMRRESLEMRQESLEMRRQLADMKDSRGPRGRAAGEAEEGAEHVSVEVIDNPLLPGSESR